jgi:hypothetical protein
MGVFMKIYIKTEKGKRIVIPIPIWVLKMGSGKWVTKFINNTIEKQNSIDKNPKYLEENNSEHKELKNIKEKVHCIDEIDFIALRESLDILKRYKGLKILDVKSNDGTQVQIIV